MSFGCDLLIVGAGPAGMAAAASAARLGLATCLVDQQSALGGQIYRRVEEQPHPLGGLLGPDYARGYQLAAAVRENSVRFHPGTTVFDMDVDGWAGLVNGQIQARFVRARRILLATGAMERPFPIPGWTLPGVMSAGGAQILLKEDALTPRKPVLVGTGPLTLLLAAQLHRAGGTIPVFLDTMVGSNYRAALRHLPRALRSHGQLRRGLALLVALKRSGTRHVTSVEDLRIEGEERVQAVTYRRRGQTFRVPAETVLLHQGIVPNIQITQALRCDHVWDEGQLCWRPRTDRWGHTSHERILVAGDGGGIAGAVAAEHSGRVAALTVAHELGFLTRQARDACAEPIFRARAREDALRPFLDQLYRPRASHRVPADDVIVCRCEEVKAGEIRTALAEGACGPNQLKAYIRSGMGACQGRMCGLPVCEIIAAERGLPPREVGYYRIRPPIRPIPLGAYADATLPVGTDDHQSAAGTGSGVR